MFKHLREIFVPRTLEQTYLQERLRSAAWLGWDMRPAPRTAISLVSVNLNAAGSQSADAAPADALLVHPSASGKPA